MEEGGLSEELKKFEILMDKWGIKPPDDSNGSKTESSGSEKWVIPLTLNQLLANWCSERFKNPLETVEALRQGESLKEAAASLFWYCYSSQDNFKSDREALLLKVLHRQVDHDYIIKILKEFENTLKFNSQLTEISEQFTLENTKYPSGQNIEVGVLVGAALVILQSRIHKWHKKTQELIERIYGYIEEEEYEFAIGMPSIGIEKTQDNVYVLSGKVTDLLLLLACVIIRDAIANLRAKQKDDRTAFVLSTGIVNYCSTTLADTFEDSPGEVDCDVSIHLSYSGARSLDVKYIKQIFNLWELVKQNLPEAEDWKEMQSCLKILVNALKRLLVEPDEIIVLLSQEIAVCNFAIKNPGIHKFIDNTQREMRERMVIRYFFPKGLYNYFENGTLKLVMDVEYYWLKQDFGPMADKMRKVLEIELIATLPFLKFTKMGNNHLFARRIADAIENNEEEASTQIDSLAAIEKTAKKQLKNKLPGFIKKVVEVRNFFIHDYDLPGITRDRKEKYREDAERVHREFFGINTEGLFPFLIRCKKKIG